MQLFASTAINKGGLAASFGTIEILLPGPVLCEDLATGKADLQRCVLFCFEAYYRGRAGTNIPNFTCYSKALYKKAFIF